MAIKAKYFVIVFTVFLSLLTSYTESSEIRIISPIGAVSRSIIPGWGQIYTHNILKGAVIFLSVGILGGGGVRADAIYRDVYNNKYLPAAIADSTQADFYFDRSNQYYKLSRFLFYTAAGIWAYAIIDSYVDAHIYNARQQTKLLDIDDRKLQQFKTGVKLSADKYYDDSVSFLLTNSFAEMDLSLHLNTGFVFTSDLLIPKYAKTVRGD